LTALAGRAHSFRRKFGRELVRPPGFLLRAMLWDGTERRFLDLDTEEKAALASIDESILRRINFAGGDVQGVNSADLHQELMSSVRRIATAEDGQFDLLTFSIMASWLPDRTLATPTVSITAPSRAELLPIAYFLYSVCRNALVVEKPSKVALPGSCITTIWDATTALEGEVTRFVRSGSAGFGLFGSERIWQRGPAFILGTIPNGEATVHVRLGCPSVVPSRSQLETICLSLQPKLLGHRMRLLSAEPAIPDLNLSLPYGMAVQVRVLQAATDDAKHQSRIAKLVQPTTVTFLDDFLISVRGAVLEVLFIASHTGKSIACGELAEAATELLAQRQEPFFISARRVGSELRQLGLYTKAIPGGRGIVFEPNIKSRIHTASFEFDLPAMRSAKIACATCEKLRQKSRNPN
jgi:hypothetical protein